MSVGIGGNTCRGDDAVGAGGNTAGGDDATGVDGNTAGGDDATGVDGNTAGGDDATGVDGNTAGGDDATGVDGNTAGGEGKGEVVVARLSGIFRVNSRVFFRDGFFSFSIFFFKLMKCVVFRKSLVLGYLPFRSS